MTRKIRQQRESGNNIFHDWNELRNFNTFCKSSDKVLCCALFGRLMLFSNSTLLPSSLSLSLFIFYRDTCIIRMRVFKIKAVEVGGRLIYDLRPLLYFCGTKKKTLSQKIFLWSWLNFVNFDIPIINSYACLIK